MEEKNGRVKIWYDTVFKRICGWQVTTVNKDPADIYYLVMYCMYYTFSTATMFKHTPNIGIYIYIINVCTYMSIYHMYISYCLNSDMNINGYVDLRA